jgi:hypothetical protein
MLQVLAKIRLAVVTWDPLGFMDFLPVVKSSG